MDIYARFGDIIHIGRAGENEATNVIFNVLKWYEEYGRGGTFLLAVEQEHYLYSQPFTQSNDTIIWIITSANTKKPGIGKCELIYLIDNVVVKSAIYDILVTVALDTPTNAPPSGEEGDNTGGGGDASNYDDTWIRQEFEEISIAIQTVQDESMKKTTYDESSKEEDIFNYVDNKVFITTEDIDEICGQYMYIAKEEEEF